MTRDPDLEGWLMEALTAVPGIGTKPMFGGLGVMRDGNLLAGVRTGRLMLRLGPEGEDDALSLPGVTPMESGGRRMRGYVFVEVEDVPEETRAALVRRAIMFSETLPSKPAKPPKPPKPANPPRFRR